MRFALFGPVVLSAIVASPAAAADRLSPIQVSASCAPLPASSLQDDAPRIIGVQDTVARTAYGRGDLIVVGAGLGRGLQLDQRYYVRRGPLVATRHAGASGPRGASTAGWVRIVAVNETTAIALVEFACDALLTGDLLQPYADPVVPFDADRTDTAGEPDFSAAGRVLFGDNERISAGVGDFLVTDLGDEKGMAPGGRFAIYRNLGIEGVPLAAIGEAIVVSVLPEFSVIRITRSRDAVMAGDLLVPRRRP
jgi:hypothetical protein